MPITENEQVEICKAIAKTCMGDYPEIASHLVDRLQQKFSMQKDWNRVYRDHYQEAKIEAVGTVDTEDEIRELLGMKFQICNYQPGLLSIHYPQRGWGSGGGLYKYIRGLLAERLGKQYDPWNYRAYQEREKSCR